MSEEMSSLAVILVEGLAGGWTVGMNGVKMID